MTSSSFPTGLRFANPMHSTDRNGYRLTVDPINCLPLNAKVEDVPTDASAVDYGAGGAVNRAGRVAFDVSLDEGKPFNVLEDLGGRRTYFADGDERYATKRAAVLNLARILLANDLATLPDGYTMDDLNKLKGFRWSPKAGCTMCPCSPAFMSPLLANKGVNWVYGTFKVKAGERVAKVLDLHYMQATEANPAVQSNLI